MSSNPNSSDSESEIIKKQSIKSSESSEASDIRNRRNKQEVKKSVNNILPSIEEEEELTQNLHSDSIVIDIEEISSEILDNSLPSIEEESSWKDKESSPQGQEGNGAKYDFSNLMHPNPTFLTINDISASHTNKHGKHQKQKTLSLLEQTNLEEIKERDQNIMVKKLGSIEEINWLESIESENTPKFTKSGDFNSLSKRRGEKKRKKKGDKEVLDKVRERLIGPSSPQLRTILTPMLSPVSPLTPVVISNIRKKKCTSHRMSSNLVIYIYILYIYIIEFGINEENTCIASIESLEVKIDQLLTTDTLIIAKLQIIQEKISLIATRPDNRKRTKDKGSIRW